MVSKNYEKIHTFSMKPSPAQICAYVIVILQVCIFYILIRSNIKSQTSALILTILFSVTLAFLLLFSFLSSYIDPSDSVMILCKNGNRNQLDGKLQDLLYCDTCDTYVTKNAKHCRDCGRCVQNFDHHCMWINNCVGSKNYVQFVFMIASTFSNFTVYLASVIIISLQKQWYTFMGIIITIWVAMSIVFILWFLLFNLNLLHLYLSVKGYTTYQFIVARRQENRRKQLQKRNKKIQQEEKKRNKIMEAQKKKNQEEKKRQIQLKKKNNQIEQTTEQNFQANKNDQKQIKTPEKIDKQIQNSTNSNIKLFNKEAHQVSNTILLKGKEVNVQNVVFDENQTEKNDGRYKSSTSKNCKSQFKSEVLMSEQLQNKKDEQANFSESQSNDSLKMSSFFVRNKSYNFILSNKSVISPHKKLGNSAIIGEKPIISRQPIQINRNKSKSSLISHYSYESVVKFPAKQLNNSQIKK